MQLFMLNIRSGRLFYRKLFDKYSKRFAKLTETLKSLEV